MKLFSTKLLECVFYCFLALAATFEIIFFSSTNISIIVLMCLLVITLLISKGFLILFTFPSDSIFLLVFRILIHCFSFACIFGVLSDRLLESELNLKNLMQIFGFVKINYLNQYNITFFLAITISIIIPSALEITGLMLKNFDSASLFSILKKVKITNEQTNSVSFK